MEEYRELGMLRRHRDHIIKNMEKLIRCTNYKQIISETLGRGLLSDAMRRNIEDINADKHILSEIEVELLLLRRYFEKITKRGPNAYEELKAILRALRCAEALRILNDLDDGMPFVSIRERNSNRVLLLEEDIVDNCISDIQPNNRTQPHNDADKPLTPYTELVLEQTRVVRKSTTFHVDEDVGVYPMQTRNRGVLLVVNIIDFQDENIKRNGAERDGDALLHIFREIGFTTFSYKNLHQDQFLEKLKALTTSEYVQDTECFVMVLMTHGERANETDMVQFSDGSICNVRKIIDHFHSSNCPKLVNKPKVLILPFCRGETPDKGKLISHNVQTDGISYTSVATLSDILLCYASTPGFETHRDPEAGSWFIQKFCDVMADYAHNTSLEDILKKTNAAVGKMRTGHGNLQTGAFENLGFNKKLYFNPGLFND